MKLKYYLRGLGIGVVVTAIVMSVAFQNRRPMSDEEVKKRAAELGMIENSIIADVANKDKEETVSDVISDENTEEISDETSDVTENEDSGEVSDEVSDGTENVDTDMPTDDTENEETDKTKVPIKENENEGTVTITVVRGDSSWTVSKRMEEAGLIESAKDFDTHLCRYGYDKKISVGSYKIPVTATHEEMAKILTKMN